MSGSSSAYASFLRGINVGGHRPIPMAALAELYATCGLTDARTYLQSGNVVFRSGEKDPRALASVIGKAIGRKFGFDVSLTVIDKSTHRRIFRNNPLLKSTTFDTNRLFVGYPLQPMPLKKARELEYPTDRGDRLFVTKDVLYVECPLGAGKTRLTNSYLERALGIELTMRNWNTVTAIEKMMEALEEEE